MSRVVGYLRESRIRPVTRTNLVKNPRPASTASWRISAAEDLTFIANDRGAPALEAVDNVGEGGLYLDPAENFMPALDQWVGVGYDLCALDAMTADRMRVTFGAYSGDAMSVGPMVAPLDRPRVNLCTDPRATTAPPWTMAATSTEGTNPTETMITNAWDGPMLPDGSRASTYVRYTIQADTTANAFGGHNLPTPAANYYPAGTKAALAIYARVSRSVMGGARLYGRGITATGTYVDATFTPSYSDAPAGQWVRLSMVHTATQPFGAWLPFAHFSNPGFKVGDTIDLVCAMVEPFTDTVAPHFDAAMDATPDVEPVWAGTPNASISRGLRPYKRLVHASRLVTYDPAGFIRALAWPNPQVAYPQNGFRLRRAVITFGSTEAEVRGAVSSYFDGDSQGASWSGTPNASTSSQRLLMVAA